MKPSTKLTRHYKYVIELAEQYNIHDIRVFGSVARGEDNEYSDLDLLVTPDLSNPLNMYLFANKVAFYLDVERINVLADTPSNHHTAVYKSAIVECKPIILFKGK